MACFWAQSLWSAIEAPEYQLKAAYLLNFGRFVEWPTEASDNKTMKICVVGKDPFGEDLERILKGQTVQGRTVQLERYAQGSEPAGCNILYVSSSEASRLEGLFSTARKYRSLTVGELPGFAEKGGIIQLYQESDRIRFRINLRAASQNELKISSKLLSIATVIQ